MARAIPPRPSGYYDRPMSEEDLRTLTLAVAEGLARKLPEAEAALAALQTLQDEEREPGPEEHRLFEAAIYAVLQPEQ